MSATLQHTPGPWSLGDCNGLTVLGPRTRFKSGQRALACIATCDDSEKSAEDEANARLIAAAPDLLNALGWALTQVDDDLCPDHQAALNAAYAAIAKATNTATK